jgi:hypothetical protein
MTTKPIILSKYSKILGNPTYIPNNCESVLRVIKPEALQVGAYVWKYGNNDFKDNYHTSKEHYSIDDWALLNEGKIDNLQVPLLRLIPYLVRAPMDDRGNLVLECLLDKEEGGKSTNYPELYSSKYVIYNIDKISMGGGKTPYSLFECPYGIVEFLPIYKGSLVWDSIFSSLKTVGIDFDRYMCTSRNLSVFKTPTPSQLSLITKTIIWENIMVEGHLSNITFSTLKRDI